MSTHGLPQVVSCPACEGTGEIAGGGGGGDYDIRCPICHGERTLSRYQADSWTDDPTGYGP